MRVSQDQCLDDHILQAFRDNAQVKQRGTKVILHAWALRNLHEFLPTVRRQHIHCVGASQGSTSES